MKIVIKISILFVCSVVFMACKNSGEKPAIVADAKNALGIELIANQQYPKLDLNDIDLKKVKKTAWEWKKILTENQYYVLRESGTEPPYKNEFYNNHEKGNYFCAACKLPLFNSKTKFESGTGWPSFYAPIEKSRVKEAVDTRLGMLRGEIVCARCDGHLGHVFNDGPKPTGLRYCMNSAAMLFQKSK